MSDIIETFGASLVQHGPENDRAYLMKLDANDLSTILPRLDSLARQQGYSKLFAKVPAATAELFVADGFEVEACVPDFYKGVEDGVFLGKYLQEKRATEAQADLVEEILQAAAARSIGEIPPAPPATTRCERLQPKDSVDMADLYREVFATYPFPIHDPAYLEETMQQDVHYFGIRGDDSLLAVASAEIDFSAQNAEMTDFATRPEARGTGLATALLGTMESSMRSEGICTAYTIARAYSFGMNITFARHNYLYSGTLTNNTQISGGLESMNVWHKAL